MGRAHASARDRGSYLPWVSQAKKCLRYAIARGKPLASTSFSPRIISTAYSPARKGSCGRIRRARVHRRAGNAEHGR
eukprot:6187080-Prymnesium_polylepis.1